MTNDISWIFLKWDKSYEVKHFGIQENNKNWKVNKWLLKGPIMKLERPKYKSWEIVPISLSANHPLRRDVNRSGG